MILVDREKDRIVVRWRSSDPRWSDRLAGVKRISGARFRKDSRDWTVPLTLQTCRDLRAEFGADLGIGRALWEWAAEERARVEAGMAHLAVDGASFQRAGEGLENLPRLAPVLYGAMENRPYQLPAVAFAALHGASLNGDDPGLGKTLDTLGALLERHPDGGRFLIVAPKTSIRVVWEREIRRWLPGLDVAVYAVGGGRARRAGELDSFLGQQRSAGRPRWTFVIVNFEMVECNEILEDAHSGARVVAPTAAARKDFEARYPQARVVEVAPSYPQLFSVVWEGVVVDEGHRALIRRSGRETLVRRGLMALNVRSGDGGGTRLALTGSPFKGKAHNIWGTLNWLYPTRYTSRWNFIDNYMHKSNNGFGIEIGGLREERTQAFYAELDTFMIRRTKDELHKLNPAWAPPPRSYYDVWCEMAPAQAKAYKAMETNAAVKLGNQTMTANGILAELTRLKQFASAAGELDSEGVFHPALPSGKFDQVVEKLEELGISGDADEQSGSNKVVIGSQFAQLIDLFSEALAKAGIPNYVLTGATKESERVRLIERFQNPSDPTRVFLINTYAGGVSITLDAADDMFILDETWIPDDQDQLEGRIHRAGNVDHKVRIWYFLTQGTIEEAIRDTVDSRDYSQRLHLDGRRGVEFAKERFGARVQ